MKNSLFLKWLVCFVIVTFCVGIVSLSLSFAQEKTAISTKKEGVKNQPSDAATTNQPEILIETKEYDAGEVYEGDEVVHSFIVKNKGKGELLINKVKPGWGCDVTSFDKVIPSGQEGKVTLKVKAKQSRGGKLKKSATVYSNDPKKPNLRLTLTGTIKTFISVDPSSRVYLNGYEGDVISKSVKIINHVKTPLKITDLKSTIDDKINYELKPLVEGKKYELTVNTMKGLKGRTYGLITLNTNIDKKPKLEIKVSINFRDDLIVSPNVIHFGRIEIAGKSQAKLNLNRNITFKKERGEPVKIQKIVPSSDIIQTSIETREEGKLYKISVSLNKDKLHAGKIEETLEIQTDYKKKPVIKVRVRGNVI